ncbi:MAG: hypothetical protein PHE88_00820 [Elusimicrobia bacterium]|nr:hypothetical protein [Elusimicrobiota bacterium]
MKQRNIYETIFLSVGGLTRTIKNIGSGFDKMINDWKYFYKIEPGITGDFDYYKIVFRFLKT